MEDIKAIAELVAKELRHCIFCNEKPNEKNKEHILPRWLLEMTGDPNRKLKLGLNWERIRNGEFAFREFAVSHLTAPSCESCNQKYGDALESKAKIIFEKIDARGSITASEAEIFLDWLDKVRVGLWLYFTMLNKNPFSIRPNFRIDHRIQNRDRFAIIYPYNQGNGFNNFGIESPLFYLMPSCFGIRINGTLILNVSNDFVLSRKSGFPYPRLGKLTPGGILYEDIVVKNRMIPDPLPLSFYKFSMGFGQIVHPKEFYLQNQQFYRNLSQSFIFDGERVKSRIYSFDQHGIQTKAIAEEEQIQYGFIEQDEAVKFWKLTEQVFRLQEFLFNQPFLQGVQNKEDYLKLHKKLALWFLPPKNKR